MSEHEPSAPPSPPPSPPVGAPRRATTGSYPAVESDGARGLRIALDVRRTIGTPPNAADPDDKGSGFWKLIHAVQETLSEIKEELAEERRLREKRASVGGRVAWKMVETLIPVVLLAALAWLAGFHR